MTPRLNSVDMSRWGGALTEDEAKAIWDLGVSNIKVGDGWSGPGGSGEWARQQATAWLDVNQGRGGTLDAYIYLYMAGDPIQQVKNAFDTLHGLPVRMWWLDAEDLESPALSPADREGFLSTAEATVAKLGGTAGIYTGRWWWIPNMANSTLFSDLPLWNSYYDKDPDEDGLPYGGWEHSAVEQYDDTQYVGGQSVDVNYDRTLDEEIEMPDPRVDALISDIAALKRAVFAGSEQPGDDAARLAYANFKIGEGGQSVNDRAASALAIALKAHGEDVAGLDEADVLRLAAQVLSGARIVPGG